MSSQASSSTSQDPADVLRTAQFSRSEGSAAPLPENVTASDVLLGAYDPARLHPMAGLGDKLDYLLLDDDKTNDLPGSGTAVPSRGWSDDLCYGTGTMYLGGMQFLLLINFFSRILALDLPCLTTALAYQSHLIVTSYCLSTITCSSHICRPCSWWCMGLSRGRSTSTGCCQF